MFNSPAVSPISGETSRQAQTGLPDDTRSTLRNSVRLDTAVLCKKKSNHFSTWNFYPSVCSFFVNAMLRRRLCIALRRAFSWIREPIRKGKFSRCSRKSEPQTTGNLQGLRPLACKLRGRAVAINSSGKSNPQKEAQVLRDFQP
jgi:hypothetical protein